ncbi:MAG: VWA domain-containing protein [Leptolinea sp.]|jgi:hypothetical protein|nr:VWA domain-containing protein [Leptolinea sp.]
MPILLCRFRLFNRIQRRLLHKSSPGRGQVIVIFAVTLLAMIFFTGLAIDAGSLYVTYSQLRRSVDAAAVAAANDYKAEGVGTTLNRPRMTKAALEVLKLHGLNASTMNLVLHLCDDANNPPEFQAQCPVPPDSPRKLVRIDATLKAPLYFLSLIGFRDVPLQAHTVAEAAPIDLVIVIDTSESMANETAGYTFPFDPYTCNQDDSCEPLHKAKVAAKGLIDTMYDGYDHVAVVNFDVTAPDVATVPMRDSLQDAKNDVDALKVHNDPPSTLIRSKWYSVHKDFDGDGDIDEGIGFNPVYPEDSSGDGLDNDDGTFGTNPSAACSMSTAADINDRWDSSGTSAGWTETGIPCDDESKFDSYDWDNDGVYTDADDTLTDAYLTNSAQVSPVCDGSTDPPTCPQPYWTYLTPNSTCTGCGLRVGAQVLKNNGRANAVWVMVFLSDGLVNLSDTHSSTSMIGADFPLGYCTGGLGSFNWATDCVDIRKDDTLNPRYCLDNPATTCPPGSISALADPTLYSVYDYALDMVDYAALTKSDNGAEVAGEPQTKIAIYAIGLGGAGDIPAGASGPIGEYLLRYAASVGDDGSRANDPCAGVPTKTNCGQYYYTSTGTGLGEIFNDISTRIYSRLTQ